MKKKPIEGRCCTCGYEGEKETLCRKREDKTHCVHWYDGVTADVLQDMLLMVDVKASLKTIRGWTLEQQREAEHWAAKYALKASDNPVRVPPKPRFLPASDTEKRLAKA